MLKLFLRASIILIIALCVSPLLAIKIPSPEDLERSKTECVVSGVPRQKLEQDTKGVMTLCFKKQAGYFEHVAIVFEMVDKKSPYELTARMLHYGRADDCCGIGGTETPLFDGQNDTLAKLCGGKIVNETLQTEVPLDPSYKRYASWIISNENLLKAKGQVETDSSTKNYRSSHTCVTYAAEIMRNAGVQINFNKFFPNTPNHLKWLVTNSIDPHWLWGGNVVPRPHYTEDTLSNTLPHKGGLSL